MRATSDSLDFLHGFLCETIVDELKAAKARKAADPDYEISPQLIDKAMKYLAMNGVTAPATSPRLDRMATVLADLDLDEEAAHGRH